MVAAGAVVLVTGLTGLRVPRTEIELDVQLSQLTFVLPTASAISDPLQVSALGVSSLGAIEVPRSRQREGERYPGPGVQLTPATAAGGRGSVNLDALALPAGAKVSLRTSSIAHEYELFIDSSDAVLAASVDGRVRVVLGRLDDTLMFDVPRPVRLTPKARFVKLDFALVDTATQALSYQLGVRQLQFSRLDEFTQADRPISRSISTIRSGTLYLESIDGAARALREGEGLQFTSSAGQIRELELGGDGIRLRFVGVVHGMTVGAGDVKRSLMPTWFDWFSARHRVPFLWGATAYFFGLITTVLRWWRQE